MPVGEGSAPDSKKKRSRRGGFSTSRKRGRINEDQESLDVVSREKPEFDKEQVEEQKPESDEDPVEEQNKVIDFVLDLAYTREKTESYKEPVEEQHVITNSGLDFGGSKSEFDKLEPVEEKKLIINDDSVDHVSDIQPPKKQDDDYHVSGNDVDGSDESSYDESSGESYDEESSSDEEEGEEEELDGEPKDQLDNENEDAPADTPGSKCNLYTLDPHTLTPDQLRDLVEPCDYEAALKEFDTEEVFDPVIRK